MKGLIVAGVAALAGVAGVVGLSGAATGGGGDGGDPVGSVPALTTTAPTSGPTLGERLAEVRRAERAAERAMARTAPASFATPVTPAAPVAMATTFGRTVTASGSGDDDGTADQGHGDRDPATGAYIDDGGHHGGDDGGHGRGRGRGGEDD
ncbi:MAG: hypothetical protein AB7O78_17850 [Thermoleophilia bacterium]